MIKSEDPRRQEAVPPLPKDMHKAYEGLCKAKEILLKTGKLPGPGEWPEEFYEDDSE